MKQIIAVDGNMKLSSGIGFPQALSINSDLNSIAHQIFGEQYYLNFVKLKSLLHSDSHCFCII